MAGKTHSKQIAVFKTAKALLEFMDESKFEKDAMAWPYAGSSRIRIHAKDYSDGVGDLATDAFYNLSADEFYRLHSSVMKVRTTMGSEYTRAKRYHDRLCTLKSQKPTENVGVSIPEIEDIAKQFISSPNEIFQEAGEQLCSILSKVSAIPSKEGEPSKLDRLIAESEKELEELSSARDIFSELKILNYPQYANPENEEERRVTMLKLVYHPRMNYPYAFTVANGWGIPQITKMKGVVIKEGTARFVDTVNICLDEKSLFPMLRRVEMFLQAMTTLGLSKYYETVTNPVLFYELNEEE